MRTKEQHISKKLQHTVYENHTIPSHLHKHIFASVANFYACALIFLFSIGSLEKIIKEKFCRLCVVCDCNKDFGLKSIKVCINARS